MKMCWLLLLGLQAGCSILPQAQELRVYQLPGASLATTSPVARAEGPVLRVNRPLASPLLDSTRIVVMPDADQLSAYQGVRWSDRPPVLLRDRLVEHLRSGARLKAVVSDDLPAQAALELAGELQAFQIEYRNGNPVAVVRLQATVLRAGNREIMTSRAFAVERQAQAASVEAAVEALGLVSDELARELSAWLDGLPGTT
ncbi:MAG TPA: ABC-type transport auxiliary lipoprotein family protein [Pseudomonas sp.]|jgi:cholesterol transport system auxiliary component|nr:ABC-type transport auxiliary lipoprotein family protein [Pseudomonas sp.]